MKLVKLVQFVLYVAVFTATTSCSNLISSAVESGLVLIVAKHDQTVEKRQKKYTATDRCVVKDEPDAFELGKAIAYGQPITAQYDIILSRTGDDIEPVAPHQLAYAFFVIADKIRDVRAKERMSWMEHYMPREDTKEIRSIIEDKFLSSHLEKCFIVPDEYKQVKSTRQLIMERILPHEQEQK